MQGYELSSYDSIARPMAGARSNPVFNVTRARKKAESEILVGDVIFFLEWFDFMVNHHGKTDPPFFWEKKSASLDCLRGMIQSIQSPGG